MRSAQVIIATTMLAVPASAVALTTSTAAPVRPENTPLNLQVTPSRVTFGHAVRVTGVAPIGDAARRVVLQAADAGGTTWRQIAATVIGARGRFRLHIAPRRSGELRAVEQPAPTTAPTALAAAAGASSAPRPVTVAARFAVGHEEHAVLGGGPMRVGGKLLPAVGGRAVALQRHIGRGWRTVASGRTGRTGGFRLSYSPGTASGERLRMLFRGDAHNAPSSRAAGTVNVFTPTLASWYDDGGNTACGFHAEYGVANKSLPCGARVALHYGGRTVIATVDDRGPYVGGREYDLNQNTAGALGFAGVGTVWASIA
jgi:hypothetical protein